MFKKILVPLDGSENSQKIVGWATGLARALKAEIILLSVIDTQEIAILKNTIEDLKKGSVDSANRAIRAPSDVIGETFAQAKGHLQTEADRIQFAGVTTNICVESGSPAEVIVSKAHNQNVDVIAMATQRESALARGILGSVTDRVLHSTSIPMFTLYPDELQDFENTNGGLQRVVVPLDGSSLSETAIEPALEIAVTSNSEIIFTEVLRLPFFGVGIAGIEYGGGDYSGDLGIDNQKEEIAGYLNTFVQEAKSLGLNARASIRIGSPSQQIVDEASEIEKSIVVMGSHGSGGLKRWVVGSVADKVVRSARRPVLIIPPKTG
jgi:nucleotide-binding universal stress UspA family protein